MLRVRHQLTKKEESNLKILLDEMTDIYGDFYITRNNLRLFIKENVDLLYKCLKKGDKIAFDENVGIIFATGWSDKAKRKYLKILPRDAESADRLLKIFLWHVNCDIYAKVKKNNPVKRALQKNNFKFIGDRGREILLYRKYVPNAIEKEYKNIKEEDNDN